MKRVYCLVLIPLTFLAISCTTTHAVRSTIPDKIKLETNKVIYLGLPRDGRYQAKIYRGSAQFYQELLEIGIENYASKIILGKEYENLNVCKVTALNNNADYLHIPAYNLNVRRNSDQNTL